MKKTIILMLLLLAGYSTYAQSHWSCDEHAFEQSMTAYIQLKSDDVVIGSLEDFEVAAFCGDECRGIATILDNPKCLYLRLRSNVTEGETMEVRCYSRSRNVEYPATISIPFIADQLYNYPSAPLILELGPLDAMVDVQVIGKGTVEGTGEHHTHTIVTLTATPDLGYHFDGWFDGEDTLAVDSIYEFEILGNRNFTAHFSPNIHQVSYVGLGNVLHQDTLAFGSSIVTPTEASITGHTFIGWDAVPEEMPDSDVVITGSFIINSYLLTYIVDGDTLQSESIVYASKIEPLTEQAKEGYTFSGWSEIPAIMPAGDVTVTGSFSINKYVLTYILDGETVQSDSVTYATQLTPCEEPTKEGYTFSGWSESPAIMPAGDVTVTGSFTINKYVLTYILDGEVVQSDSVTYATQLTPREEPTKEGYTFSGWSESPAIMPAGDVTVTGSFSINKYVLTYILDGETVQSDSVTYATQLTPCEEPTKEGYTFSGWSEIPAIMPAGDVTVTGSFTINKYVLTYILDGEVVQSDSVTYATQLTPREEPIKEGYTFSGWSEIPNSMPAYDVTITGSFSINTYILTYMVDNEVVKNDSVVFATPLTPLTEPIKEGFSFSSWSEVPEIMPASDVTVTGSFSINTYQISYMVDGIVWRTDYIPYGQAIENAAGPDKRGFVFNQWNDMPTDGIMPAHDVTVTAYYSPLEVENDDTKYVFNEEADGYEFVILNDRQVTDLIIPHEIDGIPVSVISEGTFAEQTQIQVLTWDNPTPVENSYFATPEEHGNLLIFVASDTTNVTYEGNVVRNGVAERITLYDGRPMTNPNKFMAKNISITKEFNKETILGSTSGWETIVVPFDVDSITTEDGGLIAPFGSESATDRHFWLAKMDVDAGFVRVTRIRANVPYIISMPNSERYKEEYRITGKVTFHGTNVEVQPTANAVSQSGPQFGIVPTYQEVAASDSVYVLNDEPYEADGITWPAGSIFVRSSRAARPFEAYTYANASSSGHVKGYIPLDEMATGIEDIKQWSMLNGQWSMTNSANPIYDLSGRKLSGSFGSSGRSKFKKGIYVNAGRKLIIK